LIKPFQHNTNRSSRTFSPDSVIEASTPSLLIWFINFTREREREREREEGRCI
jgi:hypothetical protein